MTDYYLKKLQEISKDKQQRDAYDASGNTVVIAGPGSGKTTVLTLKVMRLLEESIVPPRGLACLTYSTEAAREFKGRLLKLGLNKRVNAFLGTVHSFCLSEVLTPFAKLYPQYQIPYPIKIISECDKKKLFEVINNSLPSPTKMLDMDKERSRNISGISKVFIESYDLALRAAVSFEEELQKSGYIDFISMVKYSVLLIQNEFYIRKSLEAKFPWIVIDEYQDLGRPLHEIVLSLLDMTNIKVFAVGDVDQSIYDFQGAAPDYLTELSGKEGVQCIRLLNNYRSSQEIVDASESVLSTTRGYKASGKLKDYPSNIEFLECDYGMDEQYEAAIERILQYNAEGIPFHEMVVLAGNNNILNELKAKCIEQDIPTHLARQKFRITDFMQWMIDCACWVEDNTSVCFNDIYSTWEYFLDCNGITIYPEDRILVKRKLLRIIFNSKNYSSNLLDWLEYMTSQLDINTVFAKSERFPDEMSNFELLKQEVIESEAIQSIEFLIELSIPENQLVLSTRHSAKGLEFDVVIMLGMEKDSFPYYNSSERQIEEAHRLCFVAVSRARKACILIRSKHLQNRYGRWFDKEPSPFWLTLQEHMQRQQISVN